MVWRVHHALADGLSLVTVAEELITLLDGSPVPSVIPTSMKRRVKPKKPWFETLWSSVVVVGQILALPNIGHDDPTMFSKSTHEGMVSAVCERSKRQRQFVSYHVAVLTKKETQP